MYCTVSPSVIAKTVRPARIWTGKLRRKTLRLGAARPRTEKHILTRKLIAKSGAENPSAGGDDLVDRLGVENRVGRENFKTPCKCDKAILVGSGHQKKHQAEGLQHDIRWRGGVARDGVDIGAEGEPDLNCDDFTSHFQSVEQESDRKSEQEAGEDFMDDLTDEQKPVGWNAAEIPEDGSKKVGDHCRDPDPHGWGNHAA
jgi:hypothetical protein